VSPLAGWWPTCRASWRGSPGFRRQGPVGIGAYNGSEGNPKLDYAKSVLALRDKWQALINRTLLAEKIPEKLPVEP
jgi:hypothetical protein